MPSLTAPVLVRGASSAVDLENQINARLALLPNDAVIVSAKINLSRPSDTFLYRAEAFFEYSETGVVQTHPFRVKVFEASSPEALVDKVNDFSTLSLFISRLNFVRTDRVSNVDNKYFGYVFTCADPFGGFANWAAGGPAPLSPGAVGWKAVVDANGGLATSKHVALVNWLLASIKDIGVESKVLRLNFFCGGDLTAARVPQVKGSGFAIEENTNFVNGDYVESAGITGNGTSKHLDTGQSGLVATFGGGVVLAAPDAQSANAKWIGAQNSTGEFFFGMGRQTSTRRETVCGSIASRIIVTEAVTPRGIYHMIKSSNTLRTLYRDGASIATNTVSSSSGAPADRTITVFAGKDSTVTFRSTATLGGYWFDDGTMTAQQIQGMADLAMAFQQALGRFA
jgi:hypothetical protein